MPASAKGFFIRGDVSLQYADCLLQKPSSPSGRGWQRHGEITGRVG